MSNPQKANSPVATEEFTDQGQASADNPILPWKQVIRQMVAPEPPKFQDGYVDLFIRRRVCARCYGDLAKQPAPNRKWYAICPVCQDAWHYTTISRRTAEMRGQQAILDYYEIRFNPALADLFPLPWHSERKILAELGYI